MLEFGQIINQFLLTNFSFSSQYFPEEILADQYGVRRRELQQFNE